MRRFNLTYGQRALASVLILMVGSLLLSSSMTSHSWRRFWGGVEEVVASLTGGMAIIGAVLVVALLMREYVQPGPASGGWQQLVVPGFGVLLGLVFFQLGPQLVESVPWVVRTYTSEVIARTVGHLLSLVGMGMVLLGGHRMGVGLIRQLVSR